MEEDLLRKSLADLATRQEDILAEFKKARAKDWWDKFGIIGTYVSGMIVAMIGGIFTYVYQSNQAAQQRLEAARQAEEQRLVAEREERLQRERIRTEELNAVSGLLPHLSSDNEEVKRYAFLALKALGSTEITATLARLSPSRGSAEALAAIAVSPQAPRPTGLLQNRLLRRFIGSSGPRWCGSMLVLVSDRDSWSPQTVMS